VIIRTANIKDISSIQEIYNEAIRNTNATFDTKEKSIDEIKDWFNSHGLKNPIIIAKEKDNIIGWASLNKYDEKKAYSDTTELSLYVKSDFQSKGIGKKLMENILSEGKKAGVHVVLARVTAGNKISSHLHKSFGFEKIGTLKEVGKKFGKILNVHIYEKILK